MQEMMDSIINRLHMHHSPSLCVGVLNDNLKQRPYKPLRHILKSRYMFCIQSLLGFLLAASLVYGSSAQILFVTTLGSSTEFPCGISYLNKSVPIDIVWSFNDRIINQSNRVHVSSDGALKIEQARNTDVGLYSCNIRLPDNSTVTKIVKLEVTELPHSPINVKTEVNVAGGLVNVSWSPPFDGNSPIIRYIVEKRVVKNGDPSSSSSSSSSSGSSSSSSLDELSYNDAIHGWTRYPANISASQRFALLTNLRPAMTYQFRVLGVNSVGEGPPSAASNPPVTVPAQPPAGSPIGVVGAPRSATSIIIQWQPPPNDAHNGLLQGYMVRYKLAGYADTQWYYHNVTNAAQFSCLLDDLIVWRNYEISVAAYNDMGTGAYSSSIFIRTKEGKPAAPPRYVEAKATNSTTIRIRWNQTDPQLINGINQGYKVQASVFDVKKGMKIIARELIVTPHPLQDEGQEATFTDLSPYTQYFISVLCFTSAGDGPPNEPPILVTTLEDLPESVNSFKFSDVKDTSLRLTWSPPEKVNGQLLGYTLKYCSVSPSSSSPSSSSPCEWKYFNYSSNVHESVITDLKPDTTYTFEMNAVTRIGPGPSVVANVKSSVAPVEIGDLVFSDITMSRVRVSWAPPILNQNVTLVGYHVEYETQSDFGKQVKERITNYYLVVSGLKERATYTFRVRAETQTGLGPEKIGVIKTGPQPGSPSSPLSVNLTQTSVSVRLKWINSVQVEPLIGYLIEGKQVYGVDGGNGLSAVLSDEDSSWQPIVSLRNGPQTEYDLSFNHLSPSSRYTLRIMSVNSKGISEPAFPVISGSRSSSNRNDSYSKSIIITPSHLAQLRARVPFYKEAWFVILCASMTVVFTIMVIAILCVQSKAYQYKQEVLKHGLNGSGSRDALSESHYGLGGNQSVGGNQGLRGDQSVGGEEGPYAGLELRANNNHHTMTMTMTSGRGGRCSLPLDEGSGGATGGAIARRHQRPVPGSLSYSDEEDVDYCDTEAKESNFYGSSGDSLTEKPSELSSSGPDSESDHDDQGAAHFVNHYANVNDTLRKGAPSWKSQGHPYTVRPTPSHRTLERRRDHHHHHHLSSSSHHSSVPQSSGSSHSQSHHSQGNHSQYNNHHNYPPPPQEYLHHQQEHPPPQEYLHHQQEHPPPQEYLHHHHQQEQVPFHSSQQYNPRGGSDQRNVSSLNRREGQQMNRERQEQQDRPSRPAPPVPGRELPGAPPSYFSAVAGPSSSSNGNDDSDQLDSPSLLNQLGGTGGAAGGRIIVNNMAGSRAPLPGFSSFV